MCVRCVSVYVFVDDVFLPPKLNRQLLCVFASCQKRRGASSSEKVFVDFLKEMCSFCESVLERCDVNVFFTLSPLSLTWSFFPHCTYHSPPLSSLQANPNELTNGVINSAFMLLFKDSIRLFAAYNEGVINLLGNTQTNIYIGI